MKYSLLHNGDVLEQQCLPLFLNNEFPAYETFWINNIVTLTNRPFDIHFKSDPELQLIGKSDEDICIAQLHYTILGHLARAYEIRKIANIEKNLFTEGVARLSAATDVAFELLERYLHKGQYDPWTESAGKKARSAWQKNNQYPLQNIRSYRNAILHGRMLPSIIVQGSYTRIRVPKPDKVTPYLDWRLVTSNSVEKGSKVRQDFDSPNNVLDSMWNEIISYLQSNWVKYLGC